MSARVPWEPPQEAPQEAAHEREESARSRRTPQTAVEEARHPTAASELMPSATEPVPVLQQRWHLLWQRAATGWPDAGAAAAAAAAVAEAVPSDATWTGAPAASAGKGVRRAVVERHMPLEAPPAMPGPAQQLAPALALVRVRARARVPVLALGAASAPSTATAMATWGG